MFYLIILITHFYLWSYDIRHMVKDHVDVDRWTLWPPHHGLLFLISHKIYFMHHPTDMMIHTIAFVTPVAENWLLIYQRLYTCSVGSFQWITSNCVSQWQSIGHFNLQFLMWYFTNSCLKMETKYSLEIMCCKNVYLVHLFFSDFISKQLG